MIERLKTLLQKKLFANFLSLSLVQATNYLLPLLVFPYLVRVLKIENFGSVAFAQSFIMYLTVICDYSFNLLATRNLAIHRADQEKVSLIFNEVFTTKILLCCGTFLILLASIVVFPRFRNDYLLYLSSFTIVIGQALNPVWFFQGMEQMKYITYLNIIAKSVFTALVFVFVKSPADYLLPNLFQGLGAITASGLSLWLVYKHFQVVFKWVSWQQIKAQLREGWQIFISSFAIAACFSNNTFILGLFTDKMTVGYYSVGEKVILALRQILAISSQAIYPSVCRIAAESHQRLKLFLYRIFLPLISLVSVIGIMLFAFSDKLTLLIAGKPVYEIALIIRIMAFLPVITAINVPANQVLLAYNLSKTYVSVMLSAAVINLLLNFLLAPVYEAIGTAFSLVLTEIYMATALHLSLQFNHTKVALFRKNLGYGM
jgi:polysaccharide transporter, PST family